MDSVLRPRDIQARIRSGETPETVAAAAQTTVEKIMPFAGPVLAERAFVAQQAQRASVRRRAGEGAPGQLGTAVAERLSADDIDPEAVEWDAWRRDDGRWTLVAAYDAAGGPQRAEFVYDAAGRYVTAADEPSRRLVGERLPGAAATAVEPRADQLHLGDDAIELVTGRRPAPPADPVDVVLGTTPAPEVRPLRSVEEPVEEPVESVEEPADEPVEAPVTERAEPAAEAVDRHSPDEVTVDLTEPAAAVRPARPVADAGWMATQASDRPETLFEVEPEIEALEITEITEITEVAEVEGTEVTEVTEAAEAPGAEPAPDDQPTPSARSARTRAARPGKAAKGAKGRAAIPSWDEIMFGSSTGE